MQLLLIDNLAPGPVGVFLHRQFSVLGHGLPLQLVLLCLLLRCDRRLYADQGA